MAILTYSDVLTRIPGLSEYSNALITDRIAEFEEILNQYRGITVTSTTVTESIQVRPLGAAVALANPNISSVTVTCDGVAVDMTYVVVNAAQGTLDRVPWPTAWPTTATVTYTYGSTASTVAKNACYEYVNRVLRSQDTGTSRDVISQGFDGGQTRYSTPDFDKGRPTGFLEVDRLLNTLPDLRGGFA